MLLPACEGFGIILAMLPARRNLFFRCCFKGCSRDRTVNLFTGRLQDDAKGMSFISPIDILQTRQ